MIWLIIHWYKVLLHKVQRCLCRNALSKVSVIGKQSRYTFRAPLSHSEKLTEHSHVPRRKLLVMKDILLSFLGFKKVLDCAKVGKHINPS